MSGCTPALAQKLSYCSASACTASNSSSVVQMTSARSTWACAMAARMSGMRGAKSAMLRWQCESTYTGQMVCVGLADCTEVPRISSIFSFITRVFSSVGKRTPTPWVRPPEALAGVIQPTFPATG